MILARHAPLHAEQVIGDTPHFTLFASDLNGFRILRKRDEASAIFAGDDACERFRDHFDGDEAPDDATDAANQVDETDRVGRWASRAGEFLWQVEG